MQTNKDIDFGKAFDWGQASLDYAKFRDIYPKEFYQKIIDLGLCAKGQNVLDLGTGTGVLPRNLYKFGAKFTGADISQNQIEQARILSNENSMDIDYIVSSAEDICFEDCSFDTVLACQCFMYFDKKITLPKIYNILKKGGHFAILFMAWLPFESIIAKNSEDLVLKYNPDWTGGKLTRELLKNNPDFLGEMFEIEHNISFDINLSFTPDSWHGRMKACHGMGASSLPKDTIDAWEKEHLDYMKTLPDNFEIIHHCTILNLVKKETL